MTRLSRNASTIGGRWRNRPAIGIPRQRGRSIADRGIGIHLRLFARTFQGRLFGQGLGGFGLCLRLLVARSSLRRCSGGGEGGNAGLRIHLDLFLGPDDRLGAYGLYFYLGDFISGEADELNICGCFTVDPFLVVFLSSALPNFLRRTSH